jgi:hypothetical protein
MLNCLNFECIGDNLQRYLIIIYRSEWNGIRIDFNVKPFRWEQIGLIQNYIIVVNIKRNFSHPIYGTWFM